jgi:predicted SAM-dependent methyltransferase
MHLSTSLRKRCKKALSNSYAYRKPGGRLRMAVPDGSHPNPLCHAQVRPGGSGAGARNHKIIFDHVLLENVLSAAGFSVSLLGYREENGHFHSTPC